MGLRSAFRRFLFGNMNSEQLFREMYAGQPATSGENVSPESAMRCAAVFACVRVLSESEAQLPLILYERTGEGKRRATEHHVHRLLNVAPNPWQTAFEFREMMMGHACLRGTGYAYKAGSGEFMRLIPLRPDQITEEKDGEGAPTFKMLRSGAFVDVPRDRIFALRGPFGGMSPVEAYRESVGLTLAVMRQQGASFKHGAKFAGYLRKPEGSMSDNARKNLRESFDSEHSGGNAWKTPLLEEGLEWIQVGMTAEDAATIETRKMSRSEIASIFRVPPHKIGDMGGATFSNIEHQAIEFVTDTMLPWCKRWEQTIARDLLTEPERQKFYAEHLMDALLRGDTASRYAAYKNAINDGWMNRNEVRELENRDRAEGLDEFLVPLNMSGSDDPKDAKTKPEEPKTPKKPNENA